MKRWQSTLLKYGVTTAIAAFFAWLLLDLRGYAMAVTAVDRYRILADAFTIPGMLLLMVGLLVVVSNEGMFEGLSYVLSYAVKTLVPGMNKGHERYGDYVERRREKGRASGFGFLFVVGAVFMAAAGVCIALFYSVY
ncbi:MAG: DUF3899 domain-containing protein [Clostridia bacterium]|nr:DUF3899 domain-containing protein [Clostridia bacterium]